MKHKLIFKLIAFLGIILLMMSDLNAQQPTRAGTTAANFLEVGYGGAGNAMGDAYVSIVHDASSIYWNPAGLAQMNQSEAMFVIQPWVAGINTLFASGGVVVPDLGTFSIGLINFDYGEMEVTTLSKQEGTGEQYSANDLAISIGYGRKLADWFSFGLALKYVNSSIWHSSADAMALDLGVLITTHFFSPTGENDKGLSIGMSISNYGTEMKYDGIDLINPIDISPDERGNYRDVPGEFRTQGWELPLLFRLGVSVTPIATEQQEITIAANALHTNNNSESVNLGAQYSFNFPTFGKLFIRGGYKGLFMQDSQYGLSFGFGVVTHLLHNNGIKVEYAFRQIKTLGDTHSYGISLLF